MEQVKRYCQYELCKSKNRAMAPIGATRKNARAHADWNQRRFHKACYIKHCKEQAHNEFMKRLFEGCAPVLSGFKD